MHAELEKNYNALNYESIGTDPQAVAADPAHSVWVSANAGTGKTKVLTDRVLRLMLAGTAPNKILCLTFTNAAAAEMVERINGRLASWAISDEAGLISEIEELTGVPADKDILTLARRLFMDVVDNPGDLKIQTIHSFCQSLLKRFPLEAGIIPHFQVIDGQTSHELIREAWLRLLGSTQSTSDTTTRIAHLAQAAHDTTLRSIMNEIMEQRSILEDLLGEYGADGLVGKVHRQLGVRPEESKQSIIAEFIEATNIFPPRPIISLLQSGSTKDKEKSTRIKSLVNDMKNPGGEQYFADYISIFLTGKNEKRKPGGVVRAKLLEGHPDVESAILSEQERILATLDKTKSLNIAGLTASLVHTAEELLVLYRNLKTNRAFLDYTDLISAARRLLTRPDIAPWIMYKLDDGIDHILVDEAQDTSPEQWAIIEALCTDFFAGEGKREVKRTLFVVGDEKQSIFSFQGADPAVFGAMKQFFAQSWRPVLLDRSFRSTAPVLQAVDRVFSNSELLDAITVTEDSIKHDVNRSEDAGIVEIWPLVTSQEKEEPVPWELPLERKESDNSRAVLAGKIAATIRGWLDEKRILPSQGRAATEGDIMILVRKRDEFVEHMMRALKEQNINVAGTDRLSLTRHIAIMDLVALGDFLLLPEDDLTLATILKSPLIGISEQELFELAYNRGQKSLWQRVREDSGEAYDYLSRLLAKTDYMPPSEFYAYLLEVMGGRKDFIARLGDEVEDVLDEFLNYIAQYEATHIPSMQGFLQWIKSGGAVIKRDMEHGRDEVRIMTVHGSKGLQAPIVFLPDTTQVPVLRKQVLRYVECGFLWTGGAENRNRYCENLREDARQAQYEEYLRLLYVAMTRAADELYICGWQGQKNIPKNCWYNIICENLVDIADIINDGDERILRISSEQRCPVEVVTDITDTTETPELPEFALCEPAPEPDIAVPLTPSRPDGEESAGISPTERNNPYSRGRLIHLLLQILPDIEAETRKGAAQEIIERNAPDIAVPDKQQIIQEVFNIIDNPEFAEIFGVNSQAEVPISGIVGDRVISGQVDRLIVTDDKVLIIDYKTNLIPPENPTKIPRAYISQMNAYRSLLEKIYSTHQITCMLLWTNNMEVMEITDN